jgi:hypothetical protein
VKRVQQAMSDMGFAQAGSADGAFGPPTRKAVRNFRVNASKQFPDVRPTGTIDAATLRALDQLALPPLPSRRLVSSREAEAVRLEALAPSSASPVSRHRSPPSAP